MRRGPALGKLRQEDHHEFKASVHFIARPSLKKLNNEPVREKKEERERKRNLLLNVELAESIWN